MSKYARIVDKTVVEIFSSPDGFTITECFHADIVEQFSPCSDAVTIGSTVDSKGSWVIAPAAIVAAEPEQMLPQLTPMALYMAFTPAERIAIKTSNDVIVQEFWAMYQLSVQLDKATDPNLASVRDIIAYLAKPASPGPGGGILASPERVQQILAGIPQ